MDCRWRSNSMARPAPTAGCSNSGWPSRLHWVNCLRRRAHSPRQQTEAARLQSMRPSGPRVGRVASACFFEGPRYGARAHGPGARTASKMRYSPEDLAAAPHEMSADVMKPRTQSAGSWLAALASPVLGQQGGVHLNVIQERRLAALAPPPVEVLECLRTLREPRAGREQQEEREQHRNVHRDRADSVPPQR